MSRAQQRIQSFQKTSLLIFALILLLPLMAESANSWVHDKQMNFKINVPNNYKKQRIVEGTDIVHSFISPDENIIIRVRALKADKNLTNDLLIQVFEQNILKNPQRLLIDNHTLNNIPGKICGYRWNPSSMDLGLAAFYTIQNGYAYIIWSAIPINIFKQRTAESDAIINSFTLISSSNSSSASNQTATRIKPRQNSQNNHKHASTTKYFDLVSDDAKVTHKVPVGFQLDEKETGQSIWKNAAGIKMVIQTIIKQGNFKSYMDGVIADIEKNGATVLTNTYTIENGLKVANYSYEYGDTFFAYGAAEGKGMYYLVGFVGNNSQKPALIDYSEEANMSLKKVH